MSGGMPEGFDQLLRQKYAILQQGADAQTRTANADANLNTVRAGLLPAAQTADIAKTGAETGLINTQNRLAPGLAASTINLQRNQGINLAADAGKTGAETIGVNQANRIPLLDRIRAGGMFSASTMPTLPGLGL